MREENKQRNILSEYHSNITNTAAPQVANPMNDFAIECPTITPELGVAVDPGVVEVCDPVVGA